MKRILLVLLTIVIFSVNTAYANWILVSKGEIHYPAEGYNKSDSIIFNEYNKSIKIKVGMHIFDDTTSLYIYKDNKKIATISSPYKYDKRYIHIRQIEDTTTGRVFYAFNEHLLPPAMLMGFDPIANKWQVYVNSSSSVFPAEYQRYCFPDFYLKNGQLYFRFAYDHNEPGYFPPDPIYKLNWNSQANWFGYKRIQ